MWHVCSGNGILSPAEWEVFRFGAAQLNDEIELDSRLGGTYSYTGVATFDSLSVSQKVYYLALVCDALTAPHCPPPPLTATSEATVAAVFGLLRISIEMEIDRIAQTESILEDCTLRLLLQKVYRDLPNDERPFELPHPTAFNAEEWTVILESISERVLWDDDYSTKHSFMQMPPVGRYAAQIDDSYFAKPRRRNAIELLHARQTLDRLVAGHILRMSTV